MNAPFNPWIIAANLIALALLPCAARCLRGPAEHRLVGLEMTGILVILVLILLTVGYGRLPFIDLPLALALLSFGSGLVFARFLEKHL